MSQQKYYQLIDELCISFGMEDSASLHQYCNLEVDGIAFTLMYLEKVKRDELFIYADFGPVPLHLKETVYRSLLNTIHVMQGLFAPSYSLNTENGHVIQMARLPSTHWSVPILLTTIKGMSAVAQRWRQDYFLTNIEEQMTSPKIESSADGENNHVL